MTSLMTFRRGAFSSGLPVRPVAMVIDQYGPVDPVYTVIRFFDLLCLIFSSFTLYRPTMHVLPPFVPNEYLFANHRDKEGPQDW